MSFQPCAGRDCEEYVATASDVFSSRVPQLVQPRERPLPAQQPITFGPDEIEDILDDVVDPSADDLLPEEETNLGFVEVTRTHKVGAVLAIGAAVAGTGGAFVVASRKRGVVSPIFWGALTLVGTGLVVGAVTKATGLNREVIDQWRAERQLSSAVAGLPLRGLQALSPARTLY